MITNPHRISRRRFLQHAAAVTIAVVPRRVLGGAGNVAPNDQFTRAVIGVGGMGMGHVQSINTEARLLAVCDADAEHLAAALAAAGPDAKGYRDFRAVLDRPDIDIVHIASPPHWHALMSVAAADAGKDIWCEKPMTRTIDEGRKVVEAVQRNGRIFRLNTWFRFEGDFYGFGSTVEPIKMLVQGRAFGWPLKVTVSGTTGFDWKFNWSGRTDLVPEPIPPQLDYDMWLGPAPYKPYHPHRVHSTFRGYWDYDGGGLGDMGQHYLDPVQYLLEKDDTSPVEIEADAPAQDADAASSWRWIRLKYADGCEIFLDGENAIQDAPFIDGPKGKLFKGLQSDRADLQELLNTLPEPAPQVTNFLDAVRGRKKFALNEANGHRSCTIVNLSKIAVRLRRPLRFDPDTQLFIGDDEANRLVSEPMRSPWYL